MKIKVFYIALVIMTISIAAFAYGQIVPQGAGVSPGTPETKPNATAGSVVAQGGNITQVTINGETQTSAWQGFWGEVSGNITLRGAANDQLYAWNVTSLVGEVYASRNSTINFASVSTTVPANNSDCLLDEALTGTSTDRTNNTFTNSSVSFTIGNVSISRACRTFTYVSNASQTTSFEEIIVNATGVHSIYVTRINSDTVGYDGVTHDYQMIVPDNTTSATTTYFFFVELA